MTNIENGLVLEELVFEDLYFLAPEVIINILKNVPQDDLFHAFIVAPNEVTKKCKDAFTLEFIKRLVDFSKKANPVEIKIIEDAQAKIVVEMKSYLARTKLEVKNS